jgi:hypothetical protein
MNLKRSGRKWSWPNWGGILAFIWRDQEKAWKPQVRIGSVVDEILNLVLLEYKSETSPLLPACRVWTNIKKGTTVSSALYSEVQHDELRLTVESHQEVFFHWKACPSVCVLLFIHFIFVHFIDMWRSRLKI